MRNTPMSAPKRTARMVGRWLFTLSSLDEDVGVVLDRVSTVSGGYMRKG